MRADVKDISQEVNEHKVSVNFANANYDDMKKKHTNMKTEIIAVYHQIKGLNQTEQWYRSSGIQDWVSGKSFQT